MRSAKNSYFTRCKLSSSDSLQSSPENNAMAIFTLHYTAPSQKLHEAYTAKTASHFRAFFPPPLYCEHHSALCNRHNFLGKVHRYHTHLASGAKACARSL